MNKVSNIAIIDFETGGLSCKNNPVTEVACIVIDGITLEEVSRYEAVLKPYYNELLYEPEALRVTNMTMEQINSGVDFKTFTKDFLSFLKKSNFHSHAKYRTIIAGHNIVFDIGFLQQLFYCMGKKMDDYIACSTDFYGNLQPKYFDTLPLSTIKWAEDETMLKHRLIDCAEKVGIEIVNAHRAMNDVVANKDLLINFINLLRNNKINSNDTIEIETRFRDTFKF